MTMKSVSPSKEDSNLDNFELEQRKRARTIFAKVFPGEVPTPHLIEAVSNKIVVTNEEMEIDETETEIETTKLIVARAWAKDAYGDDSPTATLLAYDACENESEADRWAEVNDKLEEIYELVKKRK